MLPLSGKGNHHGTGLIGQEAALVEGEDEIIGVHGFDGSRLFLPQVGLEVTVHAPERRDDDERETNNERENREGVELKGLTPGKALIPEKVRTVKNGFKSFEHMGEWLGVSY